FAMVTFILFISSLGFFLLYNTSKKIELSQSLFIERWAQNRLTTGKVTGWLLFTIALIISIIYFGVGVGIFLFTVVLMTVASLIVLLAPLKYLSYKTLSVLFIFSLTIEHALK